LAVGPRITEEIRGWPSRQSVSIESEVKEEVQPGIQDPCTASRPLIYRSAYQSLHFIWDFVDWQNEINTA
jgi:hypothetical protein